MNTLERLHEWKHKHKARTCKIYHECGYGASCWEVVLCGEHRIEINASEIDESDHHNFKGVEWAINRALDLFEEEIKKHG